MGSAADIEAMIARVALGDRDALSRLYDATAGKLYAVCLSVLKDPADAQDVLQDVFLRVWQRADRYAVTGHSPMTWLITIARNMAIDRLRARRAGTVGLDAAPEVRDERPGPEAVAIARSDRDRIETCFGELEPPRAEAVRGAYLEGETYATLAERHGVPINTMRTWLRRSLLTLRDCLSR